jgi:hypothetical protein
MILNYKLTDDLGHQLTTYMNRKDSMQKRAKNYVVLTPLICQ